MCTNGDTDYTALCDALGHEFKDLNLLRRALTHRSRANEHGTDGSTEEHNERLEFLGDAVVDLAVGYRLMQRMPRLREGELSKLRSQVVSESGLERAARSLGLDRWVRLGRGEEQTGGRNKASILSDAFEAIIGAIFVDAGYEVANAVVCAQLESLMIEAESGRLRQDHKTRLQELSQARFAQRPRYEVTDQQGPDHAKTFVVSVSVDGRQLAQADGRSKKEAEQLAAAQALELLEQAHSDQQADTGE